MDRKQFIEAVEAKCPEYLESYIPKAVDMLEGIIQYERWDIANVIQFIPKWLVYQADRSKDCLSEGKLTPHALLTSDYLAELLKPTIKVIRKTCFGSEDPPFDRLEEAKRWFHSDMLSMNKKKLREDTERELERYLWTKVTKHADKLSKETGLSPLSLIYYILADIKPLSIPYEIRMPGAGYCKGRRKCWYVAIRVNTELSFEDLTEIYNIVKETLGVKRGKRLNQRHLEIYTMVQEQGGAPKGRGTVAFWKLLQEQWNKRHNNGDEYTTWKGIKRAYELIYERLSSQYQTKEVKEDEAGRNSTEVRC